MLYQEHNHQQHQRRRASKAITCSRFLRESLAFVSFLGLVEFYAFLTPGRLYPHHLAFGSDGPVGTHRFLKRGLYNNKRSLKSANIKLIQILCFKGHLAAQAGFLVL